MESPQKNDSRKYFLLKSSWNGECFQGRMHVALGRIAFSIPRNLQEARLQEAIDRYVSQRF